MTAAASVSLIKRPPLASSDQEPSGNGSQMSLKKIDPAMVDLIHLVTQTTEKSDRLGFYISVLAPWGECLSEHQQNLRIAALLRTTPQTVWNWRNSLAECNKMGDLYPLARACFATEYDMARAFGEAVGRDFLAEARIDPEALK